MENIQKNSSLNTNSQILIFFGHFDRPNVVLSIDCSYDDLTYIKRKEVNDQNEANVSS